VRGHRPEGGGVKYLSHQVSDMPDHTGGSDSDRKTVRDLVSGLRRAYKERRMYPADHPAARAGTIAFATTLNDYLAAHESLPLVVEETSLRWNGHEVHGGDEAGKENLAFLMFGDGIRRLAFNPGTTGEEIELLVDCLAQADGLDREDHDLATLLWEADLAHIDYSVADPFSPGDYLSGETIKSMADLVLNRIDTLGLSPDSLGTISATDPEEVERLGALRDCILTESEREELDHLARQEPELASEFRRVLLDIAASASTDGTAEKASRAYAALLAPGLRRGGVADVEAALDELSFALKNNPAREHLLTLAISSAITPGDVEGTVALLESPHMEERTTAQLFLERISPHAFPVLLDCLAETKGTAARKGLLTVLASVRPLPSATIAERLHDTRWFVIRNCVYLLAGACDDEHTLDLLSTVSFYPDERVRREVVRTLSASANERALQLLARFLHDEAASVRILAVRALGTRRSASCLSRLEESIRSKGFLRRSADETAAFLEAFADIGGEAATPLLDSLWRKRVFARNRPLDLRVAAIGALARVQSNAARNSLTQAASAKEQAVAKAAQRRLAEQRVAQRPAGD